MKIFISHSTKDYDLAKQIKGILEKNDQIGSAFIFEEEKKYGIQIDQKIIDEINDSDYLVAIITNRAVESASVNMELGYAQAKNIPKIPMIEENSDKGFLVYGTENIDFSKENFAEKCIDVLKFILANGPTRKKYTEQELIQAQKSAHFRGEILLISTDLMDLLLTKLNTGEHHLNLEVVYGPRIGAVENLIREIKNPEELDKKLLNSTIGELGFIYKDFQEFEEKLEDANRYPNSDLFPDEQDALIRLKDQLSYISSSEFNIIHYLKTKLETDYVDYKKTFREIISKSEIQKIDPRYSSNYRFSLTEIVGALVNLVLEMDKIAEKFGGHGVKVTGIDDFV